MNHHRGARSATTLGCVAAACLFSHYACPALCETLLGRVLFFSVNIVLLAIAVWHFWKAWFVTAILIASMVFVPVKTEADAHTQSPVLCILVGGAILIGGSYVGYKLYKCAKKALNPPPPPTNAPPKVSKPGEWDLRPGYSPFTILQWTNLPSVDLAIDDSVSMNGWVDWEGFPIGYCFGGTITNFQRNGVTYEFQKSADLRIWTPAYPTIIGWTSWSNGSDYNQVSVLSLEGRPFSTNWHHIDNTGTNAALLGSLSGAPVDLAKPKMFFRVAPVVPVEQ